MQSEDLEYMSELKAAAHLRPVPWANGILIFSACFITFGLLWAGFSSVDEIVRGAATVMPSSDMQVVQSLEGGIVTDILVQEGNRVTKDQPLLRIDDIQFASEGRGIEAQMTALQAKRARLTAEVSGKAFTLNAEVAQKYPDIATNEEKLYNSRQNELKTALAIIADEVREAEANLSEVKSSISKFAKSRDLLQKELEITKRLVEKKAQPEIEKIRLERELNEVSGNLSTAVQSKESLEARVSAARRKEEEKKSSFKSQALGDLNEVESRLAAISESFKSVEDKVRRTELRAPVDGVVQKIHVKTVGGVIQPAQKLVEIVPADDDLTIRARMNPADVAFLKMGQDVRVSISAYDAQIYGTLPAKVERISADAIEGQQGEVYFEIDVRSEKNHLGDDAQPLRITPGMMGEVAVIVGSRTILTYLMKPVLRARDRALTEK